MYILNLRGGLVCEKRSISTHLSAQFGCKIYLYLHDKTELLNLIAINKLHHTHTQVKKITETLLQGEKTLIG